MPGIDHGPAPDQEPADPQTAARNARYGLVLFLLYSVVYGGFVLLSAFRPELMEATPLAGVNVAILYGFGLIAGALVVALAYGWLCRRPVGDSSRRGGA